MNFDMKELEDAIIKAMVLAEESEADYLDWVDLYEYLDGRHSGLQVEGHGMLSKEEFDMGGEGHGENVYMVFRLDNTDGSFFFKKEGYYASHCGTDWDGPFNQVTPVERMVTFYE